MKITAIRSFPVWIGHRNQMIVKVETDEGLFGWGESGLSGRERAVVGAVEHFAEFLRGRDPMLTGALWQRFGAPAALGVGAALAALAAVGLVVWRVRSRG
jgi:galactonate dehydratase